MLALRLWAVVQRLVPLAFSLLGVGTATAEVCGYVAAYDSDAVAVVDTARRQAVASLGVGSGPVDVAVSPDGRRAYVTNFDADTVSVIDTALPRVVATIPAGDGPSGAAVTPDGAKLYVANNLDDTITVIDTATAAVRTTIPVPSVNCAPADRCGLNGVAVEPSGRRAYVVGARRGPELSFSVALVIIDTATDQITPRVIDIGQAGFFGDATPPGPLPAAAAVTPDGTRLFVGDWVRLKVRLYNAGASRELAARDRRIFDIAAAPDGGVYATFVTCDQQDFVLFCRGAVAVFDPSDGSILDQIETTACEPYDFRTCIPGFGCPAAERCFATGVAATPDGSEVYALDLHTGTASVIDTATQQVRAEIALPAGPLGIAIASIPGPCVAPAPPSATATRTATRAPTATPSLTAMASPTNTRTPTRSAAPGSATPTRPPGACVADCNADGRVGIEEIVRAVAIALGERALATCRGGDANGDLEVTVDDLIAAVRAALEGCGAAAPSTGVLMPCRAEQTWTFDVPSRGSLVVSADTRSAATAADLCVELRCGDGTDRSSDDIVDCTFPPPLFRCPRLAVDLAAATSCEVDVTTCSDECADPTRADYELRVTLDGVSVPLGSPVVVPF